METEARTSTTDNNNDIDNNNDAENNNDADNNNNKRLFKESTYSYLIYSPKDRSLSEFLIGILTIISQYVLLGIIIKQGNGDLKKDEIAVTVTWTDCDAFGDKGYKYDTFPPVELLKCEANKVNMGAFYLTLVFMSYFIAGDFFQCLKIFIFERNWISKVLVAFVLVENVMVIYAAIIWGFMGAYTQGEPYAAISNCIGVLFVNDIDEKLYAATEVLFVNDIDEKGRNCKTCFGKCWNQCGPVLCTIGFVVGIVMVGFVIEASLFDKGSGNFTTKDAGKLDGYAYYGPDENNATDIGIFNATLPKLCQKFVCAIDKTCCGDYYKTNPVCKGLRDTICQQSIFNNTYL